MKIDHIQIIHTVIMIYIDTYYTKSKNSQNIGRIYGNKSNSYHA